MIVFPNCKINLGLTVIRKRNDGYHDLETVFYPVPLTEVLEVIPASAEEGVTLFTTGLPVGGDRNNNLCVKAYRLLKNDFPHLPAVHLYLHKAIPVGAGLGGGSADGAFALKLLNQQYKLGLTPGQLADYALQLGSDCPFFILNKPCYATGRGEIMEEIPVDLSGYAMLLVNPGIHIDTAWAFNALSSVKAAQPPAERQPIKDSIAQPVNAWKAALVNDFEAPVFRRHPLLRQLKERLYRQGALYAGMSGSGSTVFGLFEKNSMPELSFPDGYMVVSIKAISGSDDLKKIPVWY